MARDSALVAVAVTIPMWRPLMISENKIRWPLIHVSPEALGSSSTGSPPATGTVQVSQERETPLPLKRVYAIREPSGVKTGPYFTLRSFVRGTGSPLGSNLT